LDLQAGGKKLETQGFRHRACGGGGGRQGGDAGGKLLLESIRAIRDGGGFGSIIGRNSFQRSKKDGLKLLRGIMDIYAGKNK